MENLRLRELRMSTGMNQKEYGKLFSLTQGTYSNYENGTTQADFKTLIKIADYHNVSLDYLVGRHFANDIGFLDEQERAIVKLICQLNETNKIKVASYISGMLAIQD